MTVLGLLLLILVALLFAALVHYVVRTFAPEPFPVLAALLVLVLVLVVGADGGIDFR